MNYIEMSNDELLSHARAIHGVIYKRINTLQRDLNIANEEVKRLKERENCNSPDVYCLYKERLEAIKDILFPIQ